MERYEELKDKIKKNFATKEEARGLIAFTGLDPDKGMEYLNGLGEIVDGKEMYDPKDIEKFIKMCEEKLSTPTK